MAEEYGLHLFRCPGLIFFAILRRDDLDAGIFCQGIPETGITRLIGGNAHHRAHQGNLARAADFFREHFSGFFAPFVIIRGDIGCANFCFRIVDIRISSNNEDAVFHRPLQRQL